MVTKVVAVETILVICLCYDLMVISGCVDEAHLVYFKAWTHQCHNDLTDNMTFTAVTVVSGQ